MPRGGDRSGIGKPVGRPKKRGQSGSSRVISIRVSKEHYDELVRLAWKNNRTLQDDCKVRLLNTLQAVRAR